MCWGRGDSGQLGDGATSSRSTPVAVELPSGTSALFISAHLGDHTCAVLADSRRVVCWGRNEYNGYTGALGSGSTAAFVSTPQYAQLPTGDRASRVKAGSEFSCAVTFSNVMYCWCVFVVISYHGSTVRGLVFYVRWPGADLHDHVL